MSWSKSKSDSSDLYPLDNSVSQLTDVLNQGGYDIVSDPSLTKSGSSSSGIGYRVQGLVERRLSDNLVLGGGVLYQHSDDYAPSRAMLYLRYTFDVWQGNLPMPVQPLIPYADFR